MVAMKWLGLMLVAFALTAGAARAETDSVVLRTAPSADGSFPFWCDWGYDWDERCYRDFSDRLSIGGDVDKVWRSALRFPLSAIPRGSIVLSASLLLSFDGVCLAPRKTERPCPPRSYTIDIHPILSPDWFHEREVDIGPLVSQGAVTPDRAAAALLGRDRPGHRVGRVRRAEQRPAPEARRGRGGLPRQWAQSAFGGVREPGASAGARSDLSPALVARAGAGREDSCEVVLFLVGRSS